MNQFDTSSQRHGTWTEPARPPMTMPLAWTEFKTRYDVFLSFRGDVPIQAGTVRTLLAEPLMHALRERLPGVSVFFDQRSIHERSSEEAGVEFPDAILQAILSTRGGVAAILLTPAYFQRKWCVIELACFQLLAKMKHIKLVPIVLDDFVEPTGLQDRFRIVRDLMKSLDRTQFVRVSRELQQKPQDLTQYLTQQLVERLGASGRAVLGETRTASINMWLPIATDSLDPQRLLELAAKFKVPVTAPSEMLKMIMALTGAEAASAQLPAFMLPGRERAGYQLSVKWSGVYTSDELNDVWRQKEAVEVLFPEDDGLWSGVEDVQPEYTQAPSYLLSARYAVVPFQQRGELLEQLLAWCLDGDGIAARVLYGAGGTGKTRIMIELADRLRQAHVRAGFLHHTATGDKMERLVQSRRRTVIIVDYADSWPRLTGVLEKAAEARAANGAGSVRIILLARSAGDWLEARKAESVIVRGLLNIQPLHVQMFPLEAAQHFKAASTKFAELLNVSAEVQLPAMDDPRFERPLYVHMAALAAVCDLQPSASGLLAAILEHEKQGWRKFLKERHHVTDLEVQRMLRQLHFAIAGIALRGGCPDDSAVEWIISQLGIAGLLATVPDFLHWLYPGSGPTEVRALEPDLLAEELVYTAFHQRSRTISAGLTALFADDDQMALGAAFAMFGRMSSDWGDEVAPWITALLGVNGSQQSAQAFERRALLAFDAILAMISATETETRLRSVTTRIGLVLVSALKAHGSLRLAKQLALRMPAESVALLEVAAWVQAMISRNENDDTPEGKISRAESLIEESIRLTQTDDRTTALQKAEEASNILAGVLDIAKAGDEGIQALSARSLSNLAQCLDNVGEYERAVSLEYRALDIRRKLARANGPSVEVGELALSLNNLSGYYLRNGERQLAFNSANEAVQIRRQLFRSFPLNHMSADLAMSLTNLGVMQSAIGEYGPALASTSEAVDLYTKLSQSHPDAYTSSLASALSNLGTRYITLHDLPNAVVAGERAVDIYRRLSSVHGKPFHADLANNLINLSDSYCADGRLVSALNIAEEALSIFRGLAEMNSKAYLPSHAKSLNTVGQVHARMYGPDIDLLGVSAANNDLHRQRAILALEESVSITKTLFQKNRNAHAPELAVRLYNLALMQRIVGDLSNAEQSISEAISIRRQLALDDPAVFRPKLMNSLTGLLHIQRARGKRVASRETERELVLLQIE